ncbi:hypothetical protein WR25_04961 [Diploscapter pachys]|uniref:C-type lectin domain-containing protein n=1 Tax=Diploscapter pachys TaxID=2018661 RepID=A0A2A2JR63_9BILA|nr:hypothetical protein WR25_04961 [Diploscapter pachys]
MSDGMWLSYSCVNKLPFVCRGPAGLAPTTSPKPTHGPGGCPSNWTYYQPMDACYQMQVVNYDPDAEKQIVDCHGTIHSQGENEFVRDLAVKFLNDNNCFKNWNYYLYWIGELKHDGKKETCIWYNSEDFDYYLPYPHNTIWPCKKEKEISVFGLVDKKTNEVSWTDPDNEMDWWLVPDSCKSILCKML